MSTPEEKRARLAAEMAQWKRDQWHPKKPPRNRERPFVTVTTMYPIVRWETIPRV